MQGRQECNNQRANNNDKRTRKTIRKTTIIITVSGVLIFDANESFLALNLNL